MRLVAALVLAVLVSLPLGRMAGAGRVTHVVLPGESLSRIAKRYHTTAAKIRRLNRLKSNRLREGQRLKVRSPVPVPARVRVRYRARRGDSLARVAGRHKMSLRLLRRLNPKVKALLRPGQRLWVIKEVKTHSGRGLHGLESGPGFVVLDPRRSFGTELTLTRLAEVLADHALRYPDKAPILVGDLSRKTGGYLPPHVSHRRGRDVDIRYPLKKFSRRYRIATAANLDVKRAWSLIHAFIRTDDVVYVFIDHRLQRLLYRQAKAQGLSKEELGVIFQYPRGKRSMHGIIRHEPGHRGHMHVRFRPAAVKAQPNS